MSKRRPKQGVAVPALDARAIGARIRRARRSYGWDERDLADKIGAHDSTISQYENGHLVPSFGRLIALAVALRRSMEFLLFGVARRGQLHRLADHGPGTR